MQPGLWYNVAPMPYTLGPKSRGLILLANPDLQRVVQRALQISTIDFSVVETVRTIERQRFLVSTGASKTLNSRHLPDPVTGLSNAVDLAAYLDVDGDGRKELSWHWAHVYAVASAVRAAAIIEKVKIRWGGCWDRGLNDLSLDLEAEMLAYAERSRARGVKPFLDGPHFEIPVA